MDLDAIRNRVDGINDHNYDAESAHSLEDALYLDLLRAIAEGNIKGHDAQLCAIAALESQKIVFSRWKG